jgi:hypothetical protein
MSFSEIETVSKRASKAIGYSWGISEEIGKSIRILEMFNLPGISTLNQYFKKIKNNHPKKLKNILKINKSDDELCPIYTGVRILDNCNQLEDLNIIKFFNINYPLLIIPFLSRSSEIINKPIHVILDEGKYILNSNKTILTNIEKSNNSKISKELTIQFEENKNLFTDTEWKELYKLSEDTFVPETDSLKNSAAGAGLTDND